MKLMDFKKAYDRVSREAMMRVLREMNFGEFFIQMVETLYEEVGAKIEVNGQLTEEVGTGGGVRQGCPLSPYLFICVLELMAIEIRESEEMTGVREPETGEEDRVSLFADDSGVFVGDPEKETSKARIVIGRYEKATGGALHETKTMVMLLGGARKRGLTKEQLGVEFTVLEEGGIEKYLGDLVGNKVTEEQMFKKGLEKMVEVGDRWNREDLTVYGKALVANTLLLATVKFRASVNGTTKEVRSEMKRIINEFVWGKQRALVAWKTIIRGTKEGGLGLKDVDSMLDAASVKLIRNMERKKEQPWVKWMKRKERRLQREWGVNDIYEYKPKRKEKEKLKETCVFESAMKIWYELGGTTKGEWERQKEKQTKQHKESERRRNDTVRREEVTRLVRETIKNESEEMKRECEMKLEETWRQEDKERKRQNKIEKRKEKKEIENSNEKGIEIEKKWRQITKIKTREIYNRLIEKRFGQTKKDDKKKINHAMTTIRNKLTPKQREFWWKTAHRVYKTNDRVHKYKVDERGRQASECQVCRADKETWSHMEYDCVGMQRWMERVGKVYEKYVEEIKKERRQEGKKEKEIEKWTKPSREQWRLETEQEMNEEKMITIAIARWIYHKEWCAMNYGSRRRLQTERMAERLEDELRLLNEKQKKERKEKEKKNQNTAEADKGK